MTVTRPALLLLLLAGALTLTACGGGGLSKQDYTAQADGICTQLKKDLSDVKVPTSPDQFSAFYDSSLDAFSGAIDKLKKLDPPSDDADKLKNGLTEPLSKQVEALRGAKPKLEEALKSDNPEQAFKEIKDPVEEAGAGAKIDKGFLDDYGLTACASAAN